ncbi:MAG: hypothetical protein CVT59_03665 [Actinobacteria bacterium HGW-Actinobacteria-1]|jgi:hypothetical protein|nr:MAG: hypothetical protein CVT59_03665 [Actinobacteria bacterium HGW-Actinobacteria-1]
MKTRILAVLVIGILAIALIGCAAKTEPAADQGSTPPVTGDAAAGSRLAFGLHDLEDGTVQAVGTLEYRDLEGGFWAIVGGTEADGNAGTVVAVIANPEEFTSQLETLSGKTVTATGKRFEGASIRMAGPEITITSIQEMSDTGGAAE